MEVGVRMEEARAAAAGQKGERPKVGDTMLVLPSARGHNAACIGQRGMLYHNFSKEPGFSLVPSYQPIDYSDKQLKNTQFKVRLENGTKSGTFILFTLDEVVSEGKLAKTKQEQQERVRRRRRELLER
eukprot:5398740-Prymnesium_polylepis.1